MVPLVLVCVVALPGPVSRPFAPEGSYAGHWGVDMAIPAGTPVIAPADGIVSFAGEVAGVRSVTIRSGHHRVSLSYLAATDVAVGTRVRRGDVVGIAGMPHGHPGVHVSVRRDGRYVDPETVACSGRGILRLLPSRSRLPSPVSKE